MLFVVVVEAVIVAMGVHLIFVAVLVYVNEVIRFQEPGISQNILRESGLSDASFAIKYMDHIRDLFKDMQIVSSGDNGLTFTVGIN